ncbi:MAG: hypothetical protein A2Y17_07710 [Clostridiales bacterium GWF2_38_85]|nr:MAG: hypothetical protein A2Y17_07710 [Clostridiales bacterium GWF2_38_85]HBL84239.1 hypothetical protein [Clostridiales bacterium]
MKSYIAFTTKEFTEQLRTHKALIMFTVFLLFGIMNPVTAKLTPIILEMFMPEGVEITLGDPTALDSWAQFFKNIPQMGIFVLAIVFNGLMANEFTKGTLINILTKGLSRSTVILSKFSMAILLWTASYILCFAVSYGYTIYFWSNDIVYNLLFAVFVLWLFGVLIISLLLFGGVLFKNSYGSLLLTGTTVVIMFLINIVPILQKYNPVLLSSSNMDLLTGKMQPSDFTASIIVTTALTMTFIVVAIPIFNKKRI